MNTSQIIRNAFSLDLMIDLKSVFRQMWFEIGRTFANIYAWLMFKMDVCYQTRLPAGPKILAANHPSTIDPVMMTTLVPEPVSILILDTLFKIPLFGASLKLSGHIRVDACNGKASLEEGLHSLKAGRTLGIFPEGIICPAGGEQLPAHTGVARLAIASGKPVIPVGIYLDQRYICHTQSKVKGETEVGTWYFHGPYAMTVGEPMTFGGDVEDRDYVRRVAEQIMARVAVLSYESARRMHAAQRMPVSSRVIETVQFLWSLTRGALRTI
jgi:1-acyl-sn-glycerol-3-phosphate acyltransferase